MTRACTLMLLVACTQPPTVVAPDDASITCSRFEEGCFCEPEGAEIPCYEEATWEEGDLVCRVGRRSCRAGVWGACTDHETTRTPHGNALIAPPTACNPCNPSCVIAVDGPITDPDLNDDNSTNLRYDPVTGGVISTAGPGSSEDRTFGEGGDPFDLDRGEADRVDLDPDGALVLGATSTVDDSIWIANTAEGTISRFDIRTHAETGRFWVGPYGRGNDPSRTSINTAGDAFVTGRRGNFISRISTLGDLCPDTNGDGRITTSSNGSALPWGQDDCVLWTTDLRSIFPRAYVRAVAAQDIVDPVTGDVREYVWVGGCGDRKLALLDGATGRILTTTYVGVCTYGAALDGSGNLWVSTISNRRLLRLDTNRCNEHGCPWDGRCNERNSEGTSCDGAIKQLIPVPSRNRPYGITVDSEQRIWLGGDRDVQRYDPGTGGRRWRSAGIGRFGGWKAGIAADARGNVWTTGSFGVIRLDASNPSRWHHIPRNAASESARGWGVAIDADDKAWVIGRWENSAWVFEPGAALSDFSVTRTARTVRNPYTYSDMTGQQLRLAATPRGTYIETFEGCGVGTQWESLSWDADVPDGTSVSFRVRTANTRAELPAATWVGVGVAPSVSSPVDVATALAAAGVTSAPFAQVEIALESTRTIGRTIVTPRVRSVSLTHACPSAEIGVYEHIYDASVSCTIPPERPAWGMLAYRTETRGGTIEIQAQSAEHRLGLDTAAFATLSVPALPETGSIDIGALLDANAFEPNDLMLRIRIRLIPDSGTSPVLYGMAMQWDCVPFE